MNIKKFGKYLLIVLLLLLGLCAVGCLYLFFVPNSSLFGITYISYSDTYSSKGVEYTADTTSFSTVRVNSRAYAVKVVTSSSNEISVRVYSNSLGFTLVKNSEVAISSNITSNGVLVFDITEPYGLTSIGSSYVELRIPAEIEIDVTLENNSATTTINAEKLNINDLYYVTNKGNLTINSCKLTGTLDLELGKSTCTINSTATLNSNNVSLELTSGSFDSTACTSDTNCLGDITINKNSSGVIKIGRCNDIEEKIDSAGGRIEVNTLVSADIRTSDSNVYIGTVTDGLTIYLTKSGSIEVENANCICDLETNTGDITIKKSTSTLTLHSQDGDITVSNATNHVVATSDYGTINISFDSEAGNYTAETPYRSISATTKSGKIIASGVENVSITVTDTGRVELHMNNVLGTNTITGARGEVYVVINDDSVYDLTTSSISGNVNVNLLQTGVNGMTSRTETKLHVKHEEGACSTSNSLTISTTSGSLTVRDVSMASYLGE